MNLADGTTARCADSRKFSGQRHVPIFMCAGSAERNSHMRSHCRKNSLRKKGRTRRLKISCFFSNTNRFTPLGARLIDPACPPRTDSPWRIRQRAFAASGLFDQPRRASDVSRAGPIDGLSDYRPAAVRPGFAQISALAGAIAHRSSRPIRHCRAATRIAYRSLGRKSQDRFNRRRRSPLDHHARVRVERVRRSLAF